MIAGILNRIAAYVGMSGSTQPPANGYTPRFRKVYDSNGETLFALVDLVNDIVFLAIGLDGGTPEKIVDALVVSEVLQSPDQPVLGIQKMTLCPREE